VKSVIAPTPIGDNGIPSRRVVLITDDGELPICTAFTPDIDDEYLTIATRLNNVMKGQISEDSVGDCVQALVQAGKIMDAIRMQRTDKNMPLTEAHEMVAKLKATAAIKC
jgi:molybdopterin-binding protein